jgi:hypothetical protein
MVKIPFMKNPIILAMGPMIIPLYFVRNIKISFRISQNTAFPAVSGYGIISPVRKWITSEYSPQSKKSSFESPVFFHRLKSVLGTSRYIGALCALKRREILSIELNHPYH